jgi:8-oxo-dGTP pyrophosphatase MutT (NUDIX family)
VTALVGEVIEPRHAATVMLVRDGGQGIEVFMLRRNLSSAFVGGAYVVPGGAVDDADSATGLWDQCDGRTDGDASHLLGIEAGGLAYWAAAVRECFEEAGVLLAVPLDRASEVARYREYRNQVYAKSLGLIEVCQRERLRLDLGRIHYFGHWITPVGLPRRYDTRFFVTAAPPEQQARHDDGETVASLWVHPTEALARFQRGEFELIDPTVRSLDAISRFASSADLLAAAAQPLSDRSALGVHITLPARGRADGFEEAS